MMRCPYPDCPQQKDSAPVSEVNAQREPIHLADEVYLCRDCGRLSARCVALQCDALNRPFGDFCRRCGQCQFGESHGTSARHRWREVERFDFDWEFRGESQDDWQISAATNRTVLSPDQFSGFRDPDFLLEWRMVDGLIALHQGGGAIALIHPFGDLATKDVAHPVAWSKSEAEIFGERNLPSPRAPYKAEWFRPWPPIETPDRRYVLFSSPYLAMAVDLGSLPGWNAGAGVESRLLGYWGDPTVLSLAAAPIPLTGPSIPAALVQPNHVGLLLHHRHDGSYWWCVEALDEQFKQHEKKPWSKTELDRCCRLPLRGAPVEILVLADQVLVLATPHGHWLWRIEDACRSNVAAIHELGTGSKSGDADLELARHIKDRRVFSWPRQHMYSIHDDHSANSNLEQFEIAYSRGKKGGTAVETFRVWVKRLDQTQQSRPIVLKDSDKLSAMGIWTAKISRLRELVVLVGSHGELQYRPFGGNTLVSLGNLQLGDVFALHGLQLRDPLMIAVHRDPLVKKQQLVELRSLWHSQKTARVPGLALRADPLLWSNFLFTIELDKGLHLRRREFSIQSTGSNTHLNSRKPL